MGKVICSPSLDGWVRHDNAIRTQPNFATRGAWLSSALIITRKETIKGKATNCFSRILAKNPNRAATPLSVGSDSEACSSTTAVPHEFFDPTGISARVKRVYVD
jgi:hypothetical protein